MPENVVYPKKSDADAYAKQVGGSVESVDENNDGVPDGWIVEEPEGSRGPLPEELAPDWQAAADQAAYLAEVGGQKERYARGLKEPERNMGGVVDELGYRQGGMNFTNRGPVKYAKGGAVRGKRFSGSY
jgi:hypothetical protein